MISGLEGGVLFVGDFRLILMRDVSCLVLEFQRFLGDNSQPTKTSIFGALPPLAQCLG